MAALEGGGTVYKRMDLLNEVCLVARVPLIPLSFNFSSHILPSFHPTSSSHPHIVSFFPSSFFFLLSFP